jgi:hypothetical protein
MKKDKVLASASLLMWFALIVPLATVAQTAPVTPKVVWTRVQFKVETLTSYKGDYDIWSWLPRLDFTTIGQRPSGAHYYVEVTNPGGGPWITINCASDVDRVGYECGHDEETAKSITSVGVVSFTIKMKNELDGTDATLFTGKAKIEKSPSNDHSPTAAKKPVYYVNEDWNLPIGLIFIDKAHVLNVRFWVRGEGIRMDPHVFYQGKEVGISSFDGMRVYGASCSSDIEHQPSQTAAETVPQGAKWQRIQCVIGGVVGEPVKTVTGTTGMHDLSANNGDYEIKVLRNNKLARSMKFTVENGKIKDNGLTTANKMGIATSTLIVPVMVLDDQDGPWNRTAWKTEAFYGNPLAGFTWP